eukprot:Seg3788.2 transcript_id=Seg3788.2/GoldUCD/mRNA.D3Y31 product="Solute carrier family 2 facilitated glucose transporter member 12" protein_id=Seg3788.2/GoldUCD/D3Y31
MEDVNLLSDQDDFDEIPEGRHEKVVDDVNDPFLKPGRNKTSSLLRLASFVAALGGILFGYDIGIISGALLQLRIHFQLSCSQQEMVVTSLIIGGLLASIVGGHLVDQFGRRKAIIVNSLFFIAGAIAGRLILGFAVSLSAIGECIYISEIAPPARRGLLVSLNELGITIGILLAYLVNYLLIKIDQSWRIMFGLSSLPALLQGLAMAFLPSSPRWLVLKKREAEASRVILALWPHCNPGYQVQKIKNSLRKEKDYSVTDLVGKKENMRMRMVIGCGIVFFQQITGQPTVLYYAPAVFQSLGFKSGPSATLATVGLGIVKVIFTSLALLNVDRLGRRLLLLAGVITMTAAVATLSAITQPVHHIKSKHPCDKNFIGAGHTYISDPGYDLISHCHDPNTFLNNTQWKDNSSIVHLYNRNNGSVLHWKSDNNRLVLHFKNNNNGSILHSNSDNSGLNLHSNNNNNRSFLHWNNRNNRSIFYSSIDNSSLFSSQQAKDSRQNLSDSTNSQNCTRKHRHIKAKNVTKYSDSVKYICLIALMTFVAGYAIGYGPMSWLVLTEIFPVGIKGRAVAIATIFNWGTNILISMTFLEIIGKMMFLTYL